MQKYQEEFIAYATECGVLKFGEFVLKSGRISPYFFNSGLFNTGSKLVKCGTSYAQALIESGLEVDMLFGPAYKGIPLATATAMAYSQITNVDIPFAFNRKEIKDHGEGGIIVGSELTGKVLIIDDVITAGTSVKESVEIIKKLGGEPVGVLIALDRQETGQNGVSAIQEVTEYYAMPVISIITLTDIIDYIEEKSLSQLNAIRKYRNIYGIN
jgi:orotate phosphoribosyltransferase